MEEKVSQTSLYPAPIVVMKALGVKRSLEAFTENIIAREHTLYKLSNIFLKFHIAFQTPLTILILDIL